MGDRLLVVLGRVRALLRRRQAAEAAAPIVAVAGGALLAVVAAAGALGASSAWRSLAIVCSVGGAAALAVALGRALAGWRRDDDVARFVDGATGGGDLVLSALELSRGREEDGTSPALRRALVEQAAAKTSAIDLARLVPLRRARRRLVAAAGVALAWGVALTASPSLIARGFRALSAREAVTEAASQPILADVELTLTYPAYTSLAPRQIPGSSGEVLALPGTVVAVRARPLVPARAGTLYLEDGDGKVLASRPATVESGTLAADFVVDQPGGWRVAVEPPSGRAVREPAAHRIDVETDRAPRVELAAPADDLEVPGARKIELQWAADDDYGVGELSIVWRAVDGGGEQRKLVRTVSAKSGSGKLEWDLAELELKPGVRVAYHLEAKDNDTVPGPNVGASRTLYVRIYSPVEKHEEQLAAEQQLLDHAVGLLGDRIE